MASWAAMAETVPIGPRFNGPPGSGNGGYTCGRLALFVNASGVEVTPRLPPPLERPMTRPSWARPPTPFPAASSVGRNASTATACASSPGQWPSATCLVAPWTPAADLADPDGNLSSELVWAAIDCLPYQHAGRNAPDDADFRPIVLARLAIRILAPSAPGSATRSCRGPSRSTAASATPAPHSVRPAANCWRSRELSGSS
jgi:hypothetical protein